MNSQSNFLDGFYDALKAAKQDGVKLEFTEQEKYQIESFKLLKDNYYVGDLCHVLNFDEEPNLYFSGVEGKGIYKDKLFLEIGTGGDGTFFNLRGLPKERKVGIDSGQIGMIPIDLIDQIELAKSVKWKSGFIYESAHDLNVDILWERGVHIYPDTEEYVLKDAIMILFHGAYWENPETEEYEPSNAVIDIFMSACPPLSEKQKSQRSFIKRNALLNREVVKEWWHQTNKKERIEKKKALWMMKK